MRKLGLNLLLVINIAFCMLGAYCTSNILIQLISNLGGIQSRHLAAFITFAISISAGALAFILPFHPYYKCYLKKGGVGGKPAKVELIFGSTEDRESEVPGIMKEP